MTDLLFRFLRAVFFAAVAVVGIMMALVFMFSTALALMILYLLAKLRGKPFGVRAYWSQRQATRKEVFAPDAPTYVKPRPDVIDVQAREVR
jgi:hypothetical protein